MGRKPRPTNKIGRKRRVAGWMLLALGVLVAGVWVASRWCCIRFIYRSVNVHAINGIVAIGSATPPYGSGMDLSCETVRSVGSEPGWVWWNLPSISLWQTEWCMNVGPVEIQRFCNAGGHLGRMTVTFVRVVGWPIPFLLCASGAMLRRSGILARRRAMTNGCPKCGYSLAGLANDAPCPECGQGGPKAD